MEKFVMYMDYNYKGSINCTVTLQNNEAIGSVSVITDYGEVVAVCTSGNGVVKVLKDLVDNKYA
jgi:hypothetical protein